VSASPAAARVTDVVIVGGGIVGCACLLAAARRGLSAMLVERGAVAAATTSCCEGNILQSDKPPGAELDLARFSVGLWRQFAVQTPLDLEFEPKGSLVVARDEAELAGLRAFAAAQRGAGVRAEDLDVAAARELEPELSPAIAGGCYYPDDIQVQPAKAALAMCAAARQRGATVLERTEVTGIVTGHGATVAGIDTTAGRIAAGAVINAAGPWSAGVARLAGVTLGVLPRRGHVLVTEPMRPRIRHKVSGSDYVSSILADDAAAATSCVVEATRGGTVLIGATREFVGFDPVPNVSLWRELARRAAQLFPALSSARIIRAYLGFRPCSADRTPIIGPDPRRPGLIHATGHEGAGIGLSLATGEIVAALLAGERPPVDCAPYAVDPARWQETAR
jgi:glycine/D-amino acid oxidase-like deaminating enzyme